MATIKLLKRYNGNTNILTPIDTSNDDFAVKQINLTATTGTAPLVVASTTVVTNLNADLLDGNEASAFATSGHTHGQLHDQNTDTGTTSTTFHLDSDASGPKIKNESGILAVRNAADNAYETIRVKEVLIDGDVTQINSNTVNIGDNIIILNADATGTPTEDAGVEIERGDSTNARVMWNESTDRWQAGLTGSLSNIILANSTDLDSRYYTETEIGTTSGTTGSDLVGDDNSYSNFTPAAATVKGALSGIDTALGLLGSSAGSTTTTYTAGTGGITADQVVYVSANDTVLPADASAIATTMNVVGIALTTESATNPVNIVTSGLVTGVGSGWTAGELIYLSTTAGALTNTPSSTTGDVVLPLGVAKNATDLQLNIGFPIIN